MSFRCSHVRPVTVAGVLGASATVLAVLASPAQASPAQASPAQASPAQASPAQASPAQAASLTGQTSSTLSVSGTITVYGALNGSGSKPLADAFEKAYPEVKVSMVVAGSGALSARIQAERAAGGVKADVILLADPVAMKTLAKEHVLSTWAPPAAAQLPATFRGPGWVGVFSSENVIAYRTGLADPPTNWVDLTSPRFRNEEEIADPSYSGTTFGMVGELSRTLGWGYFRQLKANGVRVEESTNTVGTEIARGEVEVGITLDTFVRQLQAKGAHLSIAWPTSGAIAIPRPAGVTASCKDPAAARAFVEWLLSPAGQAEGAKLGYDTAMPGVVSKVPATARQMAVDWPALATGKKTILSQFAKIFGS